MPTAGVGAAASAQAQPRGLLKSAGQALRIFHRALPPADDPALNPAGQAELLDRLRGAFPPDCTAEVVDFCDFAVAELTRMLQVLQSCTSRPTHFKQARPGTMADSVAQQLMAAEMKLAGLQKLKSKKDKEEAQWARGAQECAGLLLALAHMLPRLRLKPQHQSSFSRVELAAEGFAEQLEGVVWAASALELALRQRLHTCRRRSRQCRGWRVRGRGRGGGRGGGGGSPSRRRPPSGLACVSGSPQLYRPARLSELARQGA